MEARKHALLETIAAQSKELSALSKIVREVEPKITTYLTKSESAVAGRLDANHKAFVVSVNENNKVYQQLYEMVEAGQELTKDTSGALALHSASIKKLSGDLASISAKIDATNEQLRVMTDNITRQSEKVASTSVNLSAATTKLTELSGSINKQISSSATKTAVDRNLNSVAESTKRSVDQTNTTLLAVEASLSTMSSNIDNSFGRQHDALATHVGSLLAAIDVHYANSRSELNSVMSLCNQIIESAQSTTARVAEDGVVTTGHLDKISAQLSSIHSRLDVLESPPRSDPIKESRIKELEAERAALQQDKSINAERIAQLLDRVTAAEAHAMSHATRLVSLESVNVMLENTIRRLQAEADVRNSIPIEVDNKHLDDVIDMIFDDVPAASGAPETLLAPSIKSEPTESPTILISATAESPAPTISATAESPAPTAESPAPTAATPAPTVSATPTATESNESRGATSKARARTTKRNK